MLGSIITGATMIFVIWGVVIPDLRGPRPII